MTLTSALLQIGYLPYLAVIAGVWTISRYCLQAGTPLSKRDFVHVGFVAAAMPAVVAITLVVLGYPQIARDTSFATYLLLSSSIAAFYLVFWPVVVLREGCQSPTLQEVFRKSNRTKPLSLRFLAGFGMTAAAALFYWAFARDMVNTPCMSSKCRAGEMALALRGTNFAPLLYTGLLNSFVIGMAAGGLTKMLVALWCRHQSSDERG